MTGQLDKPWRPGHETDFYKALSYKGLTLKLRAGTPFDLSGRMPRRLRYIPEGGSLVEVTCRTIQGQYLFRPSPELNVIVRGLLGYAQGLHNVRVEHFN